VSASSGTPAADPPAATSPPAPPDPSPGPAPTPTPTPSPKPIPASPTPRPAAARSGGAPRVSRAWLRRLLLVPHLAQLVLLARLEHRKHLVARLELGRADRDLGLAVAHDGDQPRAFREAQLLDGLAGARGALVDLHLDDLEVLLPELEQVDELVL